MRPKQFNAVGVACLCLAFCFSARGQVQRGPLLIWNFDSTLTNSLGGEYEVFWRQPSLVRTYLDPTVHRGRGGHSLRITVHRASEGFCGITMDVFPGAGIPPRRFDASPYGFLSFWVKGHGRSGDFDVELSDGIQSTQERVALGLPLRNYLPKGISTKWQEVLIPLKDFRGVNERLLLSLNLVFRVPGDHRVYLDDVAFKRNATDALPESQAAQQTGKKVVKVPRATWVWEARNLLNSPDYGKEMKKFFKFCTKNGLRDIYLNLDLCNQGSGEHPRLEPRDPERYRQFLERAHRRGMVVEALAGTPEWALKENHANVLAVVDAVLAFNDRNSTPAQFDGIHLDVEPFLLAGYADPEFRRRVLAEFLEMVAQCAERTRADPHLSISCDAPPWFYGGSGPDAQGKLVNFRGVEKTVGEHLTDLIDSVTLMDYQNRADGARGIIASALPALRYAASQGKKVIVGVETSPEPESTVYFVCTFSLEEFHRRLVETNLQGRNTFSDFRLMTFSYGANVYAGLEAAPGFSGPPRGGFGKALTRLAEELGAASDPGSLSTKAILETGRVEMARDPEWKGFQPFEISEPGTHRIVTGFLAVHSPPAKASFYGLGPKVLEEEVRSAVEWLSSSPSFGGLAFHYYSTYRELLDGR